MRADIYIIRSPEDCVDKAGDMCHHPDKRGELCGTYFPDHCPLCDHEIVVDLYDEYEPPVLCNLKKIYCKKCGEVFYEFAT